MQYNIFKQTKETQKWFAARPEQLAESNKKKTEYLQVELAEANAILKLMNLKIVSDQLVSFLGNELSHKNILDLSKTLQNVSIFMNLYSAQLRLELQELKQFIFEKSVTLSEVEGKLEKFKVLLGLKGKLWAGEIADERFNALQEINKLQQIIQYQLAVKERLFHEFENIIKNLEGIKAVETDYIDLCKFLSLVPEGGSLMFGMWEILEMHRDNFDLQTNEEFLNLFNAQVAKFKEEFGENGKTSNLENVIQNAANTYPTTNATNNTFNKKINRALSLAKLHKVEDKDKDKVEELMNNNLCFSEKIYYAQSYVFKIYTDHLDEERKKGPNQESDSVSVSEEEENLGEEKLDKIRKQFDEAILRISPHELAKYLSDPLHYPGFWNDICHLLTRIAPVVGLEYKFSTKEVVESINQSKYSEGSPFNDGEDSIRSAKLQKTEEKQKKNKVRFADQHLEDKNQNMFRNYGANPYQEIEEEFKENDQNSFLSRYISSNRPEGGHIPPR